MKANEFLVEQKNKVDLLREAYSAFLLDDKSRNELMKVFPPKYPDVIAHHVTLQFGIPADSKIPDMPNDIQVVGYADNGESLEALVVSVNGSVKRPDGKVFHITWSLDKSKGIKPVHSNNLITEMGWKEIDMPIAITVTPSVEK